MTEQWPDDSIFNDFEIFTETYKRIGDLDIQAAILKPKNMSLGRHPVIFTIHGGFLMTAHSLFAPFFSPVVLRLAERNSAIIISADYRLLPTVNGVTDVLEDIEDAWQWSRRELPAIMKTHLPGHQLDLSRVLVQGGSAGGYGALQLGLSHPDDVTAVIMTYPLVDVQDPIFVTGPKDGEDTVLRVPLESMPSVEETKSWIERNKTITTLKAGHERSPYNAATTQYGLFYDHVFNPQKVDDHDLLPLERIKSGARVPRRLWIMHGDDDSVVYIRGTHKLVHLLEERQPEVAIRLDVAPDQDHAFDHLNEDWEKFIKPGGYDFIQEYWLA